MKIKKEKITDIYSIDTFEEPLKVLLGGFHFGNQVTRTILAVETDGLLRRIYLTPDDIPKAISLLGAKEN